MESKVLKEIREAIRKGELKAFFQPQYFSDSASIGGAEALVRWVKADGTIIPPSEFIPQLEKDGGVSVVDWFITKETCKTIKALGKNAVRISVNFGREHAYDKDFIQKLNAIVEEYDVDKSLIGVEITETDVSVDRIKVLDWARGIEEAGYTIAIDDFGVGLSSLSFVKDVPAKILKIDSSFLDDNCQSEKGRIALESVFYFAKRLKLKTVIEGVETDEQLKFIHTCDCDYIQGFLFSKPIPQDDFIDLCKNRKSADKSLSTSFDNLGILGQMQLLVDSVYMKYSFIVYANLSKNSYQIMRKNNYIDELVPETGKYDEGYEYVKNLYPIEYHKDIEEAFSRQNLLKAFLRGKKRVVRVIKIIGEDGNLFSNAIEDYFFENKSNKDIYVVSFFHTIKDERLNFIDHTRVKSLTQSINERKLYG